MSTLDEIVNLTPHTVSILSEHDDFPTHVYGAAAAHPPLRLDTEHRGRRNPAETRGVPIVNVRFGTTDNTPPQVDGRAYIVSLPVALAANRADYLVPFDEVRDPSGQIIGCRSLAKVSF